MKKFTNELQTLKKIARYLSNYNVLIIISLIFAFIITALTLYVPILVGNAIDLIVGENNVDFDNLAKVCITIGVIIGTTAIFQWLMNTINNKIVYHVVKDIRNESFNKIQRLPLSFIDSHEHGDITNRVISDVDQFSEGLLLGFTQFFTSLLTVIGTFIFMLIINPAITVLVVILTPLSLFVAKFISKKTYSMFKQQSEIKGGQTSIVDEMIGNQKIVQAFNYQDRASQRFNQNNIELQKCSINATFFSSIVNPATRFINSLIYVVVAFGGAYAVINNHISVGKLTSFLSYATQYSKPFNDISGVVVELQNAIACASRIFEILELEPVTPDADDAMILTNAKGDVSIKNVDFSYTPNQNLINNLNLEVASGQRVAIVGPTGCGKTTLINLLMRFYDVDSGSISVDGHNIQNLTRKSLRQSFGMVLQETWIKHGTIKENIAIGQPDTPIEDIIKSAKLSHAHSFIKRLEHGYDTIINPDDISQGQAQLLCIARLFLCKPSILILDEATSSIDTRTEIKTQQAFKNLMQNTTSFIVAHRLSTIKEADIILVMKNGNIIERGSHDELLKMNGLYSDLYHSQFITQKSAT